MNLQGHEQTRGPPKKMNLMGSTYHSLNNSMMQEEETYRRAGAVAGDQTPRLGSNENILGDLLFNELGRMQEE